MHRRKFCQFLAGSTVVGWTLRAQVLFVVTSVTDEAKAVAAYDLNMEGVSYYSGDVLGPNGVLKASQIIAGKALLALPYVQDDHGHTFDLGEQDLKDLLAGKSVKVETTVMQDHRHFVVINPLNHANSDAVAASAAEEKTAQPPQLRALLDEHCTECHHTGSPTRPDFTQPISPGVAKRMLERMESGGLGTMMPPGFRGPLSKDDIAALRSLLEKLP